MESSLLEETQLQIVLVFEDREGPCSFQHELFQGAV